MPVAQTHDTVRHILYRVVMRNHNDGVAVFLIDRLDQLQDLLRGRVIQRAGRLIAEEDIRVLHNGASDGGSLLLTAGKLVRQLLSVIIEAERVKQLIHVQRLLTQISADFDVLTDGQVGDEVIHLENVTQMFAAIECQCFLVHVRHALAVDVDIPGIGLINAADDVQQGRFTLSCQVISKKNCRFLQLKKTILIASSVLEKDFSSPIPVLEFPSFL